MLLAVGTGLLTARLIEVDGPPPGGRIETLIEKAPVDWMSAAVIWAVS